MYECDRNKASPKVVVEVVVVVTAETVETALEQIAKTAPTARVLICGSLYLAGHVLREFA